MGKGQKKRRDQFETRSRRGGGGGGGNRKTLIMEPKGGDRGRGSGRKGKKRKNREIL